MASRSLGWWLALALAAVSCQAPGRTGVRDPSVRPQPEAAPAARPTLRLVCNEWWPYAGREGADREGFAVDLVREALRRMGYGLDYRVRPWARCVLEMQTGETDGVLAAYPIEGRDWLRGSVPLGLGPNWVDEFLVLKRKGSRWRFSGPGSLASARVAVVEGHHYPAPIERRLYDGREGLVAVSGDDPTPRLVRLLAEDRVDAAVDGRLVLEAFLAEHPEWRKRVEPAGTLRWRPVFVQLRPDLPGAREILTRLDAALLEVYASPGFPGLLARYGLSPDDGAR
ncbi:MAG: transporter substrate-binding domain-containing protein [Fimbriimonadales bacterium]|nr:transporter substrate-binding domain-containing protein [Fimbriimonadales bacterium]